VRHRAVLLLPVFALIVGACGAGSVTGDRTFVYGTGNCDCNFLSATAEGDTQILIGKCVCITHLSDPRVNGQEEFPMTLTRFPDQTPEVHWFEYNDGTLTSEEGTWSKGEGFGSEFFDKSGGLLTSGYARYLGEGTFDGLVYEYFYSQAPAFTSEDDPNESYRIAGWIMQVPDENSDQ
jgi:hypothetical protein